VKKNISATMPASKKNESIRMAAIGRGSNYFSPMNRQRRHAGNCSSSKNYFQSIALNRLTNMVDGIGGITFRWTDGD